METQSDSRGYAFNRIQSLPLPELAAALRKQVTEIISIWVQQVHEILPQTKALSFDELQDNLPSILQALADALAATSDEGKRALLERSPTQGVTRFQQRYDLRGLMTEDRLLRVIIHEQVEVELERRMTAAEEIALNMGIDLMSQQAAVAFMEHQNAKLRAAAELELKYLAFLSHDLHNNLASVTVWLQSLKQKLAGQASYNEHAETLDMAQQAILHTVGGMDRLLQSERLRKSGKKADVQAVDLLTLLRGEARRVEKRAQDKGLKITVQVPSNLSVTSDAELLTLVLQNFIDNAIKYSDKGTIRITASRESEGAGHCKISVADEGPGIADEQKDRIFAAFVRGEARGQSGVGLGLAIASEAAKLLGAELRVESIEGVGSTFSLILLKQ